MQPLRNIRASVSQNAKCGAISFRHLIRHTLDDSFSHTLGCILLHPSVWPDDYVTNCLSHLPHESSSRGSKAALATFLLSKFFDVYPTDEVVVGLWEVDGILSRAERLLRCAPPPNSLIHFRNILQPCSGASDLPRGSQGPVHEEYN